MSDQPLYLEKEGDLAWLVLNRVEKKNALTQAMWEAIPDLVAEAAADPEIKVVIVHSACPTVFSAGADIKEFEAISKDPERREANRVAVREAQRQLARLDKPTIAMIEGACVGGGCGLALACDIRFATPQARFGITPVKLGLIYSVQDSKQLVDLVGPAHAKSILFTGRLVGADEALRIGLVNELYEAGEIREHTAAFARMIADNSQWGVRGIKRIIRMILDGVVDDTPETEELFRQSFAGVDHQEGVAAFLARRKPSFPYR
ncbi:MAG: enoyl-CoA hydratase/isomerase family protein [Alphaproteobacteria bacterium]|nr:MAG: enoyl-CoA hydratase/isomerase family protein [Alphaproteobacteria bacterium]